MTKQILITGGAGFIGSRLAHRFVRDGYSVRVLDALIPQVHGDDPAHTSPLYRSAREVAEVIHGTVTSLADLRDALRGSQVVIHLAAETGTGQSMYEIARYSETNVGGTANLLELLANEPHCVERIVVASSRSVYGEGAYRANDGRLVFPPHRGDSSMANGEFDVSMEGEDAITSVPTPEDAKLHPSSVYGITKHMQESLIMTVAPTLGVESVALRYQNVYGPGQSLKNPYTGILSIFSTLIRQGKPIDVFEDGLESRDFVFIDDVVEATFLAATEPAASGETLNVGSGVATTVADVVRLLFDALGTEVPVTVSGHYRLGDIRHNTADTTRLQNVLGYSPRTSFQEGIRRFADWVGTEPLEANRYSESLAEMSERNLLKRGS